MAREIRTRNDPSSRPGALLVVGPDEYRNAEMARAVIDTLCTREEQLLCLEEINGQVETAEAAVAALRNVLMSLATPSFLGGRKIAWLRNATLLQNDRVMKSEGVRHWIDQLSGLIRDGLPPGHYLIITTPAIDGRSALYRAFKEGGRIEQFQRPERPRELAMEAESLARDHLHRAGVTADEAAIRELADRVGADAAMLAQEAQKLAAWVADRKHVSVDDVRLLTPAVRETAAWALADALGPDRAPEAMAVLAQLLRHQADPLLLVATIESRFRDMMILQECANRGWVRVVDRNAVWNVPSHAEPLLDELGQRDPRRLHPYRAARLLEEAQKYRGEQLQQAREAVLETRERMVSGTARPELLLELLVHRICSIGTAETAASSTR